MTTTTEKIENRCNTLACLRIDYNRAKSETCQKDLLRAIVKVKRELRLLIGLNNPTVKRIVKTLL